MFTLKNVEIENLVVEGELRVNELTANSINGVTKEEFACLKGIKGNIQETVDAYKKRIAELKKGWE